MQDGFRITAPPESKMPPLGPVAIAVGSTKPPALVVAGAAVLLLICAKTTPSLVTLHFDTVILAVIFLASLLSSIAGFAFSAICGALLIHVMREPVAIVELMVVCSIAIQSLSVWALRRSINWRALPAFIVGGVISLPVGIYLLLHMSRRPFVIGMGLFLIGYGAFMLFRRPVRISASSTPVRDGIAGLIGGITGGLAGFPGALVTVWCSLKPWDKNWQRGVYQPFILIMQVLTLTALWFTAPTTTGAARVDSSIWIYVAGALLGTWFGLRLFNYLSDRQFMVAINLLLIVSGLGMLAA